MHAGDLQLTIKAWDKSVRLERMRPALAGRACMKKELLGAARRIAKKIAGCGDDVRDVCARWKAGNFEEYTFLRCIVGETIYTQRGSF